MASIESAAMSVCTVSVPCARRFDDDVEHIVDDVGVVAADADHGVGAEPPPSSRSSSSRGAEVAAATDQQVVAVAAEQLVVAGAAEDEVVQRAAGDDVVHAVFARDEVLLRVGDGVRRHVHAARSPGCPDRSG